MNKEKEIIKTLVKKSVIFCLLFGTGGVFIKPVKAIDVTYYEDFYDDYYKYNYETVAANQSNQSIRVKQKTPQIQTNVNLYNNQTNQQNLSSNTNQSNFISNVLEDNYKYALTGLYKQSKSHFMFKTDVGSILNWDEIDIREQEFKLDYNFIFRNKKFVAKGIFGTGKGVTQRTSDDDIFNQDHLISHGKGKVDVKTYHISLGLRDVYQVMGWNITPFIGYKTRGQDYIMHDHVEPHPFQIERMCIDPGDWEGYSDVCRGGISPSDHGLSADQFYYADEVDGEMVPSDETVTNTTIPGGVTLSNGKAHVNIGYGDRIEDTDFCFHQEGDTPTQFTCLKRGEDGGNLMMAFGGSSTIHTREGITHKYFVDWSGPFISVKLNKNISEKETLFLYAEAFKPFYKVNGDWPQRTDWAHNPSFIDSGGSGYGILFDLVYNYKFKENIIFVAGLNYEYLQNRNADTLLFFADGNQELYKKSVEYSQYYGFGANLGLKTTW